jgi:hypothetical protein
MRLPTIALAAAALLLPQAAKAQDSSLSGRITPPKLASAMPRSGAIVLDGRLDEPLWQTVPAVADFTQTQPREGEPATQRTEVRIVFDDDALYVGARMFDTEGAAGVRTRLARRDQDQNLDYISLIFDTFHDHLGRVQFSVNPSGVKIDSYGPGGANLDLSWDAVWDVATRVDSLGWTAEFRIPFAQLRFPRDSVQTWGLQVWRLETRLNELSSWAFWRLNEVGGPPRFGHLEGLHIARGPGKAEILPYVVGRSTNDPSVVAGNPFRDSRELDARVGADFKYLLASNLTLTGTVNPDFGQVEVDPAVVNLTAFETYFPERRPFFVEGGGLFGFGGLSCFFCSDVSAPSLFYSRRIGRQPQGAGNAFGAGEYADVPDNTRLLGAAKITGSIAPGWTVATLDAVTARENATIQDAGGLRSRMEVEPFTNYFIGRVSRDLGNGGYLRGIATSVVRDLTDPTLRTQLNSHAEAAGAQTSLWWGRRTYRFMGYLEYTQIAGDSQAILRVQRSSARYFQRPDRNNGSDGLFTNAYDPSLTAMRGYAAYGRVSKEAGDWLWEASTMIKSPGFEANDVGFTSQADRIWMNGNVGRMFTRPNRFARQMAFLVGGQQAYNFGGDLVDRQLEAYASFTFHNYWDVTAFVIVSPPRMDDQATRGGPVIGRAGGFNTFLQVNTDSRKAISLNSQPVFGCRDGVCWATANLSATLRPTSSISVSVGPAYSDDRTASYWVTPPVADPTATAMFGQRYIFGQLRQRYFSMETRLNVTVSPTLTLELFLQPLIVSASYSKLHEYDRPRSLERTTYGVNGGTISATASGYTIDPDGAGPAASFVIGNPDFNYRSLRGNAVVRWEFRPGSTLFLVWTQSREDMAPVGDFEMRRDLRGLVGTRPTNILLVKMSYWLGL